MAMQAKAVYTQKLGKMYVNNPKLKETNFVLWGKKEIHNVILLTDGNLLIL